VGWGQSNIKCAVSEEYASYIEGLEGSSVMPPSL